MSQNNISFEGSMSGASMLDDRLTPLLNNIYSSNSGSTRPSYLQAGGTWFDSANGKLMLFNGISEVALLAGSEGFADEDLSNLSEVGQAIIDGKASVDLNNLSETGQAIIDGKASVDLSNLSEVGQTIIDGKVNLNLGNSTAITNCITSAPKNINMEIDGSWVTLKAGSTLYKSDGTAISIQSDIKYGNAGLGRYLVSAYSDGSGLALAKNNSTYVVYSQTEPAMASGFWLKYVNTYYEIRFKPSGGVFKEVTLPFALCTGTGSYKWTSIDAIFDFIGFIGGDVFTLQGIKGVFPRGRDINNEVQNTVFESTGVVFKNVGISGFSGFVVFDGSTIDSVFAKDFKYDLRDNINKEKDKTILSTPIASAKVDNDGWIEWITPKLPFQAVDRSDGEWAAHNAMPSDKYIDLTLGASQTIYTAPADGWVFFSKKTTGIGQYIYINTVELATQQSSTFDTEQLWIYAPIKKGQNFRVAYSAKGVTNFFRFIYAEGSK